MTRPGMDERFLLVGVVVLGAIVRVMPVLGADFPLHDGGLLYAMAGDLRTNGFALPAYTSYNDGNIPFVYPPLSLYVAAVLDAIGIGLTTVLQWLPVLLSVASIPLVYLVVRRLLGPTHAVVGAAAFALMPSSYTWLIVGGGLTRSLGLVLALVTLHEALRLADGVPRWRGAAVGIASGLTALAHPYAAAFAALSVLLILAWRARDRAAWEALPIAILMAVLTVAPWVAAIVTTHGWAPLMAGGGSRSQVAVSVASLLFDDVTGASFSVFLGIALVGLAVELARGQYLLSVWLLLSFVVLVGGGWIMPMVPMSALVAVAVVETVLPAFDRLAMGPRGRLRAVAVLITAGLIASLGVGYVDVTPRYPLSGAQRDAMRWVLEHTSQDARFVVLTGQPWAYDTASEWFPSLTGRRSLGTAQGYEWTEGWAQREARATALEQCASAPANACLDRWMAEAVDSPDYVYVAKGNQMGPLTPDDCCPILRADLADRLPIVYDGPGATIFAWSESPSSEAPTAIRVTS